MKKTAFIIAAADGILSLQTGVGVVVNSFFEAFDEISENLAESNADLFAICPLINADSADFSIYAKEIVSEKCEANSGRIFTIQGVISGNSLNEVWKGTEGYAPAHVWEIFCQELASKAESISQEYENVFLVTHDTLFADVSRHLKSSNVTVCWVPHSLGTLFAAPNQEERIEFERTSILNVVNRNDYVGYISYDTKEHLLTNYGVPEKNIISFYSGIYFNSDRYVSRNELDKFWKTYNIPAGKKVIFSWGRCAEQKGIDIIINAYARLVIEHPEITEEYHLILLSPIETSYHEYLVKIKALLECLPDGAFTFITKFQNYIQYEILSNAQTELVLLCSRFESFGLTSIEAVFKAGKHSSIIYSPIPTFKEVLGEFSHAFELPENSEDGLKDLMYKRITHSGKNEPLINSKDLALEQRFSLAKNQLFGIESLIKKVSIYAQI